MRLFILFFALFGLSACASAPTTASFGDSTAKALTIVVVPTNQSINLDVLRRVDFNSNKFMGKPVVSDVNTFGLLENLFTKNNQINAQNPARTEALAMLELEPGDYAWVESNRTIGNANWGANGTMCLGELAPVYRLEPGKISIIRFDYIQIRQVSFSRAQIFGTAAGRLSDADVLAEFERSRTNYPLIQGEAKVLKPHKFIRWDSARRSIWASRNCAELETFTIVQDPPQ